MASTRRVEIFEDPGPSADTSAMPSQSSYDFIGAIFPDENSYLQYPPSDITTFHPPPPAPTGRSPLKAVRQGRSTPPKVLFDNKMNTSLPTPQPLSFTTDSPVKKATVSSLHPIAPHNYMKPIFTTFSSTASADKENINSDNFAEFPDPSQKSRISLKRSSSIAGHSHDRHAKKSRIEGPSDPGLPDPQNMPIIDDDGKKPPYSYAMLIGMSILRAPGRRLTLAHIYKWISDTFSFYRLPETGWQNSIRHNLSLNKAFIKIERPKDDPGKGNYWAIEPGMESQFLKDKSSRRPTSSGGSIMKSSSQQPSSEANLWPSQPQALPKSSLRPVPQESEVFEPSSDATIPASDAPSSLEDEAEESLNMPPPVSRAPLSSPLQPIHSSPPVAHHPMLREDTPSPIADPALPSGNSRSRKRKLAAMDDSGYFSSLESSASRQCGNSKLLDLNTDRLRIKRGRAEEEIARIRSSSHDISPTKSRSFLRQPTPSLISSSPLRHFDTSLMLPPLTPGVKFSLPRKPPPSISPNTNLRNHRNNIRKLLGSPPVKATSIYNDEVSFSPAFNIVDDSNDIFNEDLHSSFNIFEDNADNVYGRASSSSPVKRSIRRPRIERASRTANVLADITGASLNSNPSLSKTPAFESPLKQKSTRSALALDSNFEDTSKEELFGLDFHDDEELDDFGGLDILQGFQKIGGNQSSTASTKKGSRPALGTRSHTSRF